MTNSMTRGDLAFLDTAPWKIDVHTELAASPSAVWAALTDNESWPQWFANCVTCTSTSTPKDGVGSTRTIELKGMRVDEVFIGWETERLWTFTALQVSRPLFRCLVEQVRMQPGANGGTVIDYRMALTPRGWMRPLKPVLEKATRATWLKSFAALDRQLSSPTTP